MDDSFIGRDAELAELAELLQDHRLVTIVGPPGVGKTRLAAEVASHAAAGFDEVVTVDLTMVGKANQVLGAIAAGLGLTEPPKGHTETLVAAAISERRLLVVVDNCEHVAEAAGAVVSSLVTACGRLRVLATSRVRLDAGDAAVSELAPLGPDDAARLFAARSRRHLPDDEACAASIARVCTALGGLPLAVELVAARTDVLAPSQLAAMVSERLSAVASDKSRTDTRHRGVDAAVAWSWDLLEPAAQALLRRLSVFAGGASADAAEAVCGGAGVSPSDVGHHLGHLVDASLVGISGGRYVLLEPVRQFARDQLVRAGESAEARNRHAAWALALAEEAEPNLAAHAQAEWLARLDAEAANLRAALAWCVRDQQANIALRLVGALALWWRATGAITEGRRAATAALAIEPPSSDLRAIAKATFTVALMADVQGDLMAHSYAAHALRLAEKVGDPILCARALLVLANSSQGVDPSAEEHLRHSEQLAREVGDSWCLAYALAIRGGQLSHVGLLEDASSCMEEAAAVAKSSGDVFAMGFCLWRLGNFALGRGDFQLASQRLAAALDALGVVPASEKAQILVDLGHIALLEDREPAATTHLDAGLAEAQRTGNVEAGSYALHELGRQAHARGDLPRARDLLEKSAAMVTSLGRASSTTLGALARVASEEGNRNAALALAEEAHRIARDTSWQSGVGRALLDLGSVQRGGRDTYGARATLVEATATFEAAGDQAGAADAIEELAGVAATEGHTRSAVRLFAAAESIRARCGAPRFAADHRTYSADVEAARGALTAAAFEAEWAAGASLSSDSIVAVAEAAFATSGDDKLSDKERAVAELVAQGLTNREIAARLFLSPRTVQWRLRIVFKKLGIHSRAALSRAALEPISRHPGDAAEA